mmetsp:Transcript_8812/g.22179  ORF Transcript_8812/g.22179 Transcript_8812/m.22179 type:complete len:220 (+) Transcript_8812:184-843(+)
MTTEKTTLLRSIRRSTVCHSSRRSMLKRAATTMTTAMAMSLTMTLTLKMALVTSTGLSTVCQLHPTLDCRRVMTTTLKMTLVSSMRHSKVGSCVAPSLRRTLLTTRTPTRTWVTLMTLMMLSTTQTPPTMTLVPLTRLSQVAPPRPLSTALRCLLSDLMRTRRMRTRTILARSMLRWLAYQHAPRWMLTAAMRTTWTPLIVLVTLTPHWKAVSLRLYGR